MSCDDYNKEEWLREKAWDAWKPTVREVRKWRREYDETTRGAMCVYWTKEGNARNAKMLKAEMEYKAAGLL